MRFIHYLFVLLNLSGKPRTCDEWYLARNFAQYFRQHGFEIFVSWKVGFLADELS